MRKVEAGVVAVLLMDIRSYEAPFIGKIGHKYSVVDVTFDPSMPSGYSVELSTYGGNIFVDKSAVVHIDDWNAISSRIIKNFGDFGGF
jgi:hypothetical protein